VTAHIDAYLDTEHDAFVSLSTKGGFLRGSSFRREANWSHALAESCLSLDARTKAERPDDDGGAGSLVPPV
jgi:hypothetical protein